MEDSVRALWGDGKLILGPMVRASSLPLRLTALEFGADVVYSEEIPAHRASHANCVRYVNPVLGTVDFIERKSSLKESLVLFRTHMEKEVQPKRCVLQLGCSDSITALKAAQNLEKDVAAIDINMGCAKHYSVSRGMGSALMTRPEIAEDIIKTLRRNLSIPVSVKTRLHSNSMFTANKSNNNGDTVCTEDNIDIKKSENWLLQLQACGAQAITLHVRSPNEKYRDSAHIDIFAQLHAKMSCTNTPLVYNGDIWSPSDWERVQNSVAFEYDPPNSNTTTPICDKEFLAIKKRSGSAQTISVMVCRAGLWKPSVFAELRQSTIGRENCHGITDLTPQDRPAVSLKELLACIVKHSADTANCPLNTRYLMQQILAGGRKLYSDLRNDVIQSYDLVGVSEAVNCKEYVQKVKQQQGMHWKQVTNNDNCCGGTSNPSTSGAELRSNLENNFYQHTQALTLAPQRLFNSNSWPGIVSLTSHEYNDKYFDDNYYVAFSRACNNSTNTSASNNVDSSKETTSTVAAAGAGGGIKRPFSYSGFTESSSIIIRVKK